MKRVAVLLLILAAFAACKPAGPGTGTPAAHHLYLLLEADTFTVDDRGRQNIAEENVRLPIAIHIAGAVDGKPGVKAESGRALPWDARVHTPHYEHIYVSRNAKTFFVSISMVYAVRNPATIPHTQFKCEIYHDGKLKRSQVVEVGGVTTHIECVYGV